MIAFVTWTGSVRSNDVEEITGDVRYAHSIVGYDAEDCGVPYYVANRRFLAIYVGF